MVDYEIGSTITATASTNAGEGESISAYKWTLDGVEQTQTSDTFSFFTDNITLGGHRIDLIVQNSCGEWSTMVTKYFDLVYTCPLPTADFTLS